MRIKTSLISTVFLLSGAYLVLLSYQYETQLTHLPLISGILQQRQEARQEAKIHQLNIYMIRDYRSLFDSANGDVNVNMDDYIKYFQLITEYFPTQADSYALLGFCYAHQNNIGQAFENYKKAFILNPQFFWVYYDLGLLLWYSGNSSQAASLFQKALLLDPRETLSAIASSKVYRDILSGGKNPYDILQSLRHGYEQTAVFIRMIHQGLHPPQNFPPLQFF